MLKLNHLSKSLIILLAAVSALGPSSMQILLPALPIIRSTYTVSSEVAQLTLSLSMLAIAIGTLFFGPMSDKYGRKPIMLIGLCITIVGSIACWLANSIEWLIVGRFIQAFGLGYDISKAQRSTLLGSSVILSSQNDPNLQRNREAVLKR